MNNDELIHVIKSAFSDGPFPGNDNLKNSTEGEEPFLLEAEFKDKNDWKSLDFAFIDQSPDGYGSALSFFSDQAFRFYLPAYLIADVKGLLSQSDPSFHLTHGFTQDSKDEKINPNRYGDQTWFDYKSERFKTFSTKECQAIIQYLKFVAEREEIFKKEILYAIDLYWTKRT